MVSNKNIYKITIFLGVLLLSVLIYSFDYALGWGMNLMFPNVYVFTTGTGNSGFIPIIWNENGYIEIIQIIILFLTLIILFQCLVRKPKSRTTKIFLLISFIGISYIFFEEISWGQHFIGFKSPDILLNKSSLFYNKQNEFNIHNISNLFNEIPRALVLIWCSMSVPIMNLIKYDGNKQLVNIIQPDKSLIYLSYTILLISLPDLVINKLDLIENSKLFIFDKNSFVEYDLIQLSLSILSLNFIRFSELQELLFYYYFLYHSIFFKKILIIKKI